MLRDKFIFATIFLLTSCDLSEEYKKPDINLSESWKTKTVNLENEKQYRLKKWWNCFNDKELDNIVENAVNKNFDIKLAIINRKSAIAEIESAQSTLFPQVSISPGVNLTYSKQSDITKLFSTSLNTSYEVDLWGKISNNVDIQKLEFEITKEEMNALKLTISGDIVNTYHKIKFLKLTNRLLKKKLELQTKLVDLLERSKAAGLSDNFIVISQRQSLNSTKVTIIRNNESIKNLENALSYISGESYQTFDYKIESKNDFKVSFPHIATYTPLGVINNRADIKISELKLKQSLKQIGIAKADFLPALNITSPLGFASDNLKNLLNVNIAEMGFSTGLNMPLFDGGLREANLELAKYKKEQVVVEYTKNVYSALKEVENALIEYESLVEQFHQKREFVSQATKIYNMAKLQKENGLRSNIDVLAAEIGIADTLIDLYMNVNDIYDNRVKYIKSLGGSVS